MKLIPRKDQQVILRFQDLEVGTTFRFTTTDYGHVCLKIFSQTEQSNVDVVDLAEAIAFIGVPDTKVTRVKAELTYDEVHV